MLAAPMQKALYFVLNVRVASEIGFVDRAFSE